MLRPFKAEDLRNLGVKVTSKPQEITKWRNEQISAKRENPTLVLGWATGEKEAGLARAATLVTKADVLDHWELAVEEWLRRNVQSEFPLVLFRYLFELAESGTINTLLLDDYSA